MIELLAAALAFETAKFITVIDQLAWLCSTWPLRAAHPSFNNFAEY